MMVGNAPARPSRALKEFKEQLTVLLIALLFVLLAADVRIAEVTALGWPGLLTVLALMAVVRPLSVAASTAGSSLSLRDRAFIAWLGPRGIVAAAVASFFADELLREGVEEAFELRALVFLVIAVTVVVEGLGGGLMARLLGVRRAHTGFLIAGANGLGRALASALEARDREVVLIDTDPGEVAAAEAAGLTAVVGNALDDEALEAADVEGKEGIVSVIPNEGVGILIAERARREYRVPGAYVAVRTGRLGITERRLSDIGAQPLFGREIDLGGSVALLAADRCALRSYRYDGSTDRLDWGDAGWDEAVIPLVVERRGVVAPIGRDLRLSRGDALTLLVPVGWDRAPAGFEELAQAAPLR
jgi:Trk K+ transport system NAD-binding subunit